MDVVVDASVCQGHGRFNRISPEVFELDDEGFSAVITPHVPVEHEEAVFKAVKNCPEQAIVAH